MVWPEDSVLRLSDTDALRMSNPNRRHADDWPQWMGPQRDNVWRETGIISKFPADGPKVLWRSKLAGGYSGPAVTQGKVFITTT